MLWAWALYGRLLWGFGPFRVQALGFQGLGVLRISGPGPSRRTEDFRLHGSSLLVLFLVVVGHLCFLEDHEMRFRDLAAAPGPPELEGSYDKH